MGWGGSRKGAGRKPKGYQPDPEESSSPKKSNRVPPVAELIEALPPSVWQMSPDQIMEHGMRHYAEMGEWAAAGKIAKALADVRARAGETSGKKAAAQDRAKTAGVGTGWEGILHRDGEGAVN